MSDLIVAEGRKARVVIGVTHSIVGVALAFFVNNFLSHLFSLNHQGQKWWDSSWLPLWVACLIYVGEAVSVRLPMAWLYGLLITAPPYGWCAGSLAVGYVKNHSDVPPSLILVSILLALSGAVLNPAICRLVLMGRRVASGGQST
jgi:hypothetical protein